MDSYRNQYISQRGQKLRTQSSINQNFNTNNMDLSQDQISIPVIPRKKLKLKVKKRTESLGNFEIESVNLSTTQNMYGIDNNANR